MEAEGTDSEIKSTLMTHDQELQFAKALTKLMPVAKSYSRSLLGINHRYRSLCEDFAQQAFLRAWEKRDQFAPGSNMNAWVFTILRNLIISHHRHCWREFLTDNVWNDDFVDRTQDPEKALCAKQSCDRLKFLSDQHRQALIDIGWHGLAYSEAAEVHQVPLGTMKSRVARARDLLAEITDHDELHHRRSDRRNQCSNKVQAN